MRVIELQNAFGIENLVEVDGPQPEPGDGEVLLRMRAWSLNYRDLLVAKGTYNPKIRLPFTPLSDGVGEVAAVGKGVSRVKVGDRVAGAFMPGWIDGPISEAKAKTSLGGGGVGMLAEYVVLDQESVVAVPEHLTDEEAATLPCAAVTAWNALFVSGNLKAGDSVLIQGTGGVSLFALQFARSVQARIIATSSSENKMERLRQLGAEHVVNYKTTPEWGDRVRELTDGGVDHVVEVGGAGTLAQSLRAVRMGGHVSLIGVLSGRGECNPVPILMKHICVQGIYVGSRRMFEEMNRSIAEKQMRPIVDRIFAFGEIREALRHLESGAHFGKVCLAMKS